MSIQVGRITVMVDADASQLRADMTRAAAEIQASAVGIQSSIAPLKDQFAQLTATIQQSTSQIEGARLTAARPADTSALKSIESAFLGATEAAISFAATKSGIDSLFLATTSGAASSTVSLATMADGLTNVYRLTRLALSPTLGTLGLLAAGYAVEKTGETAYGEAGRLKNEATIAAFNQVRIAPQQVRDLSTTVGPENLSPYLSLYNASGGKDLRDSAEQLNAISDPADKARKAVALFGSEAGSALKLLDQAFIENSDRVKDWNLSYSGETRDQLYQFKSDIDSLKEPFTTLSDTIGDSVTKIKMSLVELFAAGYGKVRDGSAFDSLVRSPVLAPFNLDQTVNLGGKVDDSAFGSALRGASTSYGAVFRDGLASGGSFFEKSDAQFGREFQRNLAFSRSHDNQYSHLQEQASSSKNFPASLIPDSLTDLSQINGDKSTDALRDRLEGLKEKRRKIIETYFTRDSNGKLQFKGEDDTSVTSKGDTSAIDQANAVTSLTSVDANIKTIQGKLDATKSTTTLNPVQNRIREMQAELQSSVAALNAVGQGYSQEVLAKGFAEAQKELAGLNNRLSEHKQKLSDADTERIRSIANAHALTQAEVQWKSWLDQTQTSISTRTSAMESMTAAIGRGSVAVRSAAIESQLTSQLGPKYSDPEYVKAHQPDISALRSQIGKEYDAQVANRSAQNVDALNREIAATQALTAARAFGAEAVSRAQINSRVDELRKQGTPEPEITATRLQMEASHKDLITETVAQLDQETAATNRLTAAQALGSAGIRTATVENIRNSGMSKEQADAEIRRYESQQKNATASAAMARTGEQELDSLRAQLDYLSRQTDKQNENQAVLGAILSIQREIADIEDQQILAVGSAKDGWDVFWREMKRNTRSAAQDMHDILGGAVSGVNDELAKAISGQKANWAQFFSGLAEQVARVGLQRIETGVLGKLGIGGTGGGGIFSEIFHHARKKPDFGGETAEDQANLGDFDPSELGQLAGGGGGLFGNGPNGTQFNPIYVMMAEGLGSLAGEGGSLSDLFGGSGEDSGGFSAGGVLGGLLDLIPGFAGGGDPEPGKPSIVGEEGPELFVPRAAGTVVPHGQVGGNSVTNIIDARGSDNSAAVELRVSRAIRQAQQQGAADGARLSREARRRVPNSKAFAT